MNLSSVCEDTAGYVTKFFELLEDRNIQYAILHGHESIPYDIAGDVDFCVEEKYLDDIAKIAGQVEGRESRWHVVQTLRHETTACYHVVMDLGSPGKWVKLDPCSDYMRNGALLIRSVELLKGRRRRGPFWIASVPAEFKYTLAKGLAKQKDSEAFVPRLRALYSEDERACSKAAEELLGVTFDDVEHVARVIEEANTLRLMLRRWKAGWKWRIEELGRIFGRLAHPSGMVIAVLGPDGCGKSTLIESLSRSLGGAFRRTSWYHFRPFTFAGGKPAGASSNSEPHKQRPRSLPAGIFKLIYYYVDFLLGALFLLYPARCRSTLIIFDRYFDDLLIDFRRFRMPGSGCLRVLTHWFSRICPKPDMVLVLDARPDVILARKSELTRDELIRQREAFLGLAGKRGYCVIDAEGEVEAVHRECYVRAVEHLAARHRRREARKQWRA